MRKYCSDSKNEAKIKKCLKCGLQRLWVLIYCKYFKWKATPPETAAYVVLHLPASEITYCTILNSLSNV